MKPRFYLPPFCYICQQDFKTIEELDEHLLRKHHVTPPIRADMRR